MKKFLLVGLLTGMLAVGALVPQAQASCWWNGYTWHCWHHHSWWWRHHRWHAHHYWYHPYARYYWYHPYAGYYWSPG